MSFSLKENESIVTHCQLQEFIATLTNTRLIIISATSEENFPLRGVSGIGVYDDVEKYKADLKAAKEKNTKTTSTICFGVGFLLLILLSANGHFNAGLICLVVVGIAGLFIASAATPNVKLESILNIMQHGGSRQFRFRKIDHNATGIKNFVEEVTKTLC